MEIQKPAESRVCPSVSKGKKALDFSFGGMFSRLSTFQAYTWFGKPRALSPVECSRTGWINETVDTLKCSLCEERIIVPPEIFSNQFSYNRNLEEVVKKLVGNHSKKCQWRKQKCEIQSLDFRQFKKQELENEFNNRLLGLKEVEILLPNLFTWERLSLSAEEENLLLEFGKNLTNHQEKTQVIESFQTEFKCHFLAIFGWTTQPLIWESSENQEESDRILKCVWCGAEQGLWNYSNFPNEQNNNKNSNSITSINQIKKLSIQRKRVEDIISLGSAIPPTVYDDSVTIAGGKKSANISESCSDSVAVHVPMSFKYSPPKSSGKRKFDEAELIIEKQKVLDDSDEDSKSKKPNLLFDVKKMHQLWCPYMHEYKQNEIEGGQQKQQVHNGFVATIQYLLEEEEEQSQQQIQVGDNSEQLMETVFKQMDKHQRLMRKVQQVVKQ